MNDPVELFLDTAIEQGFVDSGKSRLIKDLEELVIRTVKKRCKERGMIIDFYYADTYQRGNELIFLCYIDMDSGTFYLEEEQDYSNVFSLRQLNEDRRIVQSVLENINEIQPEGYFDKVIIENRVVGLRLTPLKNDDGGNMNYTVHALMKGTLVNIGNRRTKSAAHHIQF